MFDGNSKVALSIDDADLRAGATYIDQFSRYQEANTLLLAKIANAATKPGGLTGDLDAFAPRLRVQRRGRVPQGRHGPQHRAVLRGPDRPRPSPTPTSTPPTPSSRRASPAGRSTPHRSSVASSTRAPTSTTRPLAAAADHLQADADGADRQRPEGAVGRREPGPARAHRHRRRAAARRRRHPAGQPVDHRPLARLVGDAEDMASTRLPDTVQDILDAPLGEDVVMPELAEVDRSAAATRSPRSPTALNTVQASAADLAVEQAVLRRNIADSFVNLGRRNQNLLSRQLDSITEMERQETDPDELAEALHPRPPRHPHAPQRRVAAAAGRARAAPPVVRSGAPSSTSSAAPSARSRTTTGSSSSELDEATISGTAAADLTHLVAELLENALNFSPPGRDVEIIGRARDRRLHAGHRRQRRRHERRGPGPGQHPPGRRRVLHRRPVPLPRPLRGRSSRPPASACIVHPAQHAGRRHHRRHRAGRRC